MSRSTARVAMPSGRPWRKACDGSSRTCVSRSRTGLELSGDLLALGFHLRPVLDRLTHVREDPSQALRQGLPLGVSALAVDLDVYPGLDASAELGLGHRIDAEDVLELAGCVAANDELRVDDEVNDPFLSRKLNIDRVHDEGHVVGDDL